MRYRSLVPLTLAWLLTLPTLVSARVAAPPPVPMRLVNSDVVVIGTVTRIEKDTKTGADNQEYHIGVVQVEEAFKGAKGLTHVRVGFRMLPVGPRRRLGFQLRKGLGGCFFLTRNPKEEFLRATSYYGFLDKKSANFAKEMNVLRRSNKILDDPMKTLTSDDPKERYFTAALLISRYRTYAPRGGQVKYEPIDAKESKLILESLASADWNKPDPQLPRMAPLTMFFTLGINQADGFDRPKNYKDIPDAAKKWLRANASTYRIKRRVAAEQK